MSRAYLKRTAGDFGDTITINLQESDGSATNLTGNTGVRLQVRLEGDVPGVDALRTDTAMTVDADPTTGIVTYKTTEDDFAFAGLYYAQIEVAFATREITFDVAIFSVEEQHG